MSIVDPTAALARLAADPAHRAAFNATRVVDGVVVVPSASSPPVGATPLERASWYMEQACPGFGALWAAHSAWEASRSAVAVARGVGGRRGRRRWRAKERRRRADAERLSATLARLDGEDDESFIDRMFWHGHA